MILLLCAVLSCIPFVCASLPSLNDTSIHTLDSSDYPPSNTRTLWDIISSCGLTLFACTWTAIHPNIPGVDDGVVLITFYRLCLMFAALIIPEFMIYWAALQVLSARKAAKKFNDVFGERARPHGHRRAVWQSELAVTLFGDIPSSSRSSSAGWTLTHGFFACMGGFVLYVDGEPRATLTPDELLRFVREGSVELPVITEADIEDRSKGDVLSKCVAILQLGWFVVQLIARYAQNLPVTLLEIDTLGVATLACIAYGLWWKKPKDIRRPYIVHWRSEAAAPPPGDSLANKYYPFKRRSRVCPSLGSYDGHAALNLEIISLATGCISGVVYGGIHYLGWNFLFRRRTEQIFWRVASTGMACSPPTILFFGFMMSLRDMPSSEHRRWMSNKVTSFLEPIIFGFGFIFYILSSYFYAFSRVTIIVLMFLSLRSLPPGTYDEVAWTKFIPHVNV